MIPVFTIYSTNMYQASLMYQWDADGESQNLADLWESVPPLINSSNNQFTQFNQFNLVFFFFKFKFLSV